MDEGEDPVTPQLYINSLPGMSLQKIDALANEEQETFVGVWNDVVLRTMKKFLILVKAQINKCYKITDNTVIECLICEKVELFDVALWYLHGTEVMIEITSSDVMSRYTTIDRDKAESLKQDYFIEFEAALKDAVMSIDPESSDCVESCVQCNTPIRFVEQLP